jgi:hypothetical protein
MRTSAINVVAALTVATVFAATVSARAAADEPSTAAGRATKPGDPSAPDVLRVDVTVKYDKDGKSGVLSPGDVLTTDDNYRVIFKPTHDGYVYVYQVDAAQRVDIIFPNPKYTTAVNPVTAKLIYVVPPEGRWLRLDQTRGPEDIIVIAADVPLADPKDIALRSRAGTRAGSAPAVSNPDNIFSYRLTFEHR